MRVPVSDCNNNWVWTETPLTNTKEHTFMNGQLKHIVGWGGGGGGDWKTRINKILKLL